MLLVVTLLLRLWGIKQGLPYSYNVDEATHFVPRAIAFFSHDLNPQYFLNPPAYSYLLHVVFELWFGSGDAVSRAFATDPTQVFVVARVVAAALGTIAVWLTYLAGERLFSKTVALLGAAIFGVAFLPIFYSHLALNDVPTLAPVALALYGAAGVLRRGWRRDYVIAGVAIGLAAATKYTGAIMLLCLVAAAACDGAGGAMLIALRRLALAVICAVLAFVVANPYSVLDFSAFQAGIATQQSLAGGGAPIKLGTTSSSGTAYYLWTFTWGLGWAPSLAALGGAVLLLVRRRLTMALVLLPAPIAFIVFMGDQQRFFGRWLMPIFPIVALLGAYGTVELVRWLVRTRRVPVLVAGTAAAVVMLESGACHRDPQRRRAGTPGHAQPGPQVDGCARARRRQGGDRAGRRGQLGDRHRALAAMDVERRAVAAVPHLGDRRRRERQPAAGRRAPLRDRRRVRADAAPGAARPVRGPRLLLGGDRLAAGRAIVRPAEDRAPGDRLLRAAGQPGQARLPRQPVRRQPPRGSVQLRLVDRLLPGAVRAPGARDQRLQASERKVLT